jgi:hypothetical protein
MHYHIDSNGLQPDPKERKTISTQIGLVLSRYNNIVTNCSIKFTDESEVYPSNMIACHLTVSLQQIEVVITDTGPSINEVCVSALGRVKRNIERHLRRSGVNRVHTAVSTRMF